MNSYYSGNDEDSNVCQVCGAQLWATSSTCPSCGAKIDYRSKNRSSMNNSSRGTNAVKKDAFELSNGPAPKKKFVDDGTSSAFGTPYARGAYDKRPEDEKKKSYGGRGIPIGTIIVVLIIAAAIGVAVYFGSQYAGKAVDERLTEETQKGQVYEELDKSSIDPSRLRN